MNDRPTEPHEAWVRPSPTEEFRSAAENFARMDERLRFITEILRGWETRFASLEPRLTEGERQGAVLKQRVDTMEPQLQANTEMIRALETEQATQRTESRGLGRLSERAWSIATVIVSVALSALLAKVLRH